MEEQEKNEFELIDKQDGKLAKIGKESKLYIGKVVDKISELPNFAKDVLKSFEKSEDSRPLQVIVDYRHFC